ncbi:rhomboid family intramembrane serine protease [Haloimpatiens sp. FM7315]|uniref:rhomboid family intramembrane serine protease n=1 Tax=Haloimpatiens sp. FM7315 TaxID=3298609 RepID=UPI00370C9487
MRKNHSIVTYILIGINIAMFILSVYLSRSLTYINGEVLVFLGAKYNPFIDAGEYFRLITCSFLHGGLMHITFNMYALYAIGPVIEKAYGKLKYIVIYFVSAFTASLFSYFFSDGIAVGASGAIFGLLGAMLMLSYKMRNAMGNEFKKNIIAVIVVNIIIGMSVSNIDNYAHIGGLLGGIVTSYIIFIENKN